MVAYCLNGQVIIITSITQQSFKLVRFRQARQDLNPQPSVLETDTLPVELLACVNSAKRLISTLHKTHNYSTISVITPAPTVRPPSRMANRLPISNATGEINSTAMFTLSPGITISTPSGNSIAPVISMVRM